MKAKIEKKTDMDFVKEMAHLFLKLDITETEYGPLVVKHPFYESATHAVEENGQSKKSFP